MQVFSYLALFLIGLCVGSFLAAFTYRKERGLSVLSGRSFCPQCKSRIAWFDNIPLLSFFLLRGRCRACGKRISLRYPLVEVSTALLFLIFFKYVSPALFPLMIVVISIIIAIFVIDLESKIIPDELVFWGITILMFFYLVSGYSALFPTLFVAFSASVFFLLIHLITRGRGMGLGDVKFVILGGLLLGWPQSLIWLFLAFLTGAFMGTILILGKRAKLGREIAFGPYLAGFGLEPDGFTLNGQCDGTRQFKRPRGLF